MSNQNFSTRKDRRESVTLDRVASRKGRHAQAVREDKRASTKSARRNAYLKSVTR